jgi:hypothetical protein
LLDPGRLISGCCRPALWLASFMALCHGAVNDPPCLPRLMTDSCMVGILPSDFAAPSGAEYRGCLSESLPLRLTLFRNGTELLELDSGATARFLAEHPDFRTGDPAATDSGSTGKPAGPAGRSRRSWGEESLIAALADTSLPRARKAQRILDMGAWRSGLTISDEFTMAGSQVAVWRDKLDCDAMARIGYFRIGAGFHAGWLYGSLARYLQKDTTEFFLNHAFSLTLGVPFFRYEMRLAGQIIPEYFWLEEDISAVIRRSGQGRLLRMEKTWSPTHRSNMEHRLHFRVGHLYTDLLLDSHVYRRPIIRVYFDDMPALFGSWGASLTCAPDLWIPGAWVKVQPFGSRGARIGAWQLPVIVEPLRVHFNYWDFKRYNFGLTIAVHIDYQKSP